MKITLLQLVQRMLTSIQSENINSVNDTEESLMCVDIANTAYESMMTRKRWKHLRRWLTPSATTSKNQLILPTGTIWIDVHNVWYDKKRMQWLDPHAFLQLTEVRDDTQSNISRVDGVKVILDQAPVYLTSDDGETLVFDGQEDSTSGLMASRCRMISYQVSTSPLALDTDVFDMPPQLFPVLTDYCKALVHQELERDDRTSERYESRYERGMKRLSGMPTLVDDPTDMRKAVIGKRSRGARYSSNVISN